MVRGKLVCGGLKMKIVEKYEWNIIYLFFILASSYLFLRPSQHNGD